MWIGFDIDDTLVPCNTILCDYINAFHNQNNIPVVTQDITKWNMVFNLSDRSMSIIDAIHSFWDDTDILDILKLKKGAYEVIEELSKDNNISLITARSEKYSNETIRWVNKTFPKDMNVGLIMAADKSKCCVDILVEDCYSNLLGFVKENKNSWGILIRRAYNEQDYLKNKQERMLIIDDISDVPYVINIIKSLKERVNDK
jgi:5'(3')-deoxyribonucleotidase